MTNYTWTGATGDNLWSTPANWSPFSLTGGPNGPPGSGDAAFLGSLGESVVVGSGVNAAVDALFMGDIFDPAAGVTNAPILTVDNGRKFTIDGAGSILADGAIDVQTGATMVWDFSGTFINGATIIIGKILSGNGGQAEPSSNLEIDGTVTLNDGGVAPATLYLGDSEFQNTSAGSITNSGVTSDTLVNVNDTISGAGSISVSVFDNQAGGNVVASQVRGSALQISSATFTNEGQMVAGTTAALDFGTDGQSGSLTNTGTVRLEENADLAISGKFTISGSGTVENLGNDGANISSDQHGPATFTNESNIDYSGSGQIGDQGLNGGTAANDLTFDNDDGTVLVEGNGDNLSLNTGSNTITDSGGGLFLAEDGGHMFVDSAVITGGPIFSFNGHEFGGGGTIEALDGGTVTISAAITPGSGPPPYGNGQILIDSGTVIMAPGATDTTPINFSGFYGTLQLDSAANTVATIGGMSEYDAIDLRYQSFATGDQAVFNAGILSLENAGGAALASFALSGSYASADFTVASDGNGGTKIEYVNPPPPAGTTADMVMEQTSSGTYEIYDIGNNAILAAYPLGQILPQLQVAGLGGFDGTDTSDMLMRDMTNGDLQIDDISNNNITLGVAIGQVGLEWTVSGFGDFSGNANETDMLMRNSNTGQFEVFDIANNAITFAGPMGQVGLEWSIAGFGDFSTRASETDMLMRNSTSGAFEVFDTANNTITSAGPMGQVGLEWTIAGFGDFSTRANETDMLMRNSNTGAFEVFDIANNTITFAGPMGQVGLEWTIAGFGDFSGNANESDMLMRNSNTGVFEVFDISNNNITFAGPMGQVGLEWSISGVSAAPASAPPATQLSGIAADPADAAPGNATAQLTQAMASFAPSTGMAAASSPLGQAPPVPASNLLAASNQT